jgi:hypothetical protein
MGGDASEKGGGQARTLWGTVRGVRILDDHEEDQGRVAGEADFLEAGHLTPAAEGVSLGAVMAGSG